jgi:hypothetical protein
MNGEKVIEWIKKFLAKMVENQKKKEQDLIDKFKKMEKK